MNVVDSSAWLEYFTGGPNAEYFAKVTAPVSEAQDDVEEFVQIVRTCQFIGDFMERDQFGKQRIFARDFGRLQCVVNLLLKQLHFRGLDYIIERPALDRLDRRGDVGV